MIDREMLELAAKAAGIELWHEDVFTNGLTQKVSDNGVLMWNPLLKDDDALRLAVKLGLSLLPYPVYREDSRHSVVVKQRRSGDTLRELNPTEVLEPYGNDPLAATRRAIVRAAAEIGEAMP